MPRSTLRSQLTLEVTPYRSDLWATLSPAWKSLSSRVPTSVFLSAPWVATWLEEFGPTLRPSAHVWRTSDGVVVGCVLVSEVRDRLGPIKLKRVYLNASGDRTVGCEHNDLLADPDWRGEISTALAEVIRQCEPDELALVGFRADAAAEMLRSIPETWQDGFLSESPYVDLSALRTQGRPYLSVLSRNTRSKIRRSLKAFEDAFGPAMLEEAQDRGAFERWLEEMVDLHEARWHRGRMDGAFTKPAARRFYSRLFDSCVIGIDGSGKPQVDLLRLRFGDATMGFVLNFVQSGKVSFYQCGLRYPTDDNRFRPGLVLHALAVEHYLERGMSEYDFLGGERVPAQYKRSLSTGSRPLAWVRFAFPTRRMKGIDHLRRWRRRLRHLFAREESVIHAEEP